MDEPEFGLSGCVVEVSADSGTEVCERVLELVKEVVRVVFLVEEGSPGSAAEVVETDSSSDSEHCPTLQEDVSGTVVDVLVRVLVVVRQSSAEVVEPAGCEYGRVVEEGLGVSGPEEKL